MTALTAPMAVDPAMKSSRTHRLITLPTATPNARPVPANPLSRFIPNMGVVTPALMMGTQAAHGVIEGHDLAQYGGKGDQPRVVAPLLLQRCSWFSDPSVSTAFPCPVPGVRPANSRMQRISWLLAGFASTDWWGSSVLGPEVRIIPLQSSHGGASMSRHSGRCTNAYVRSSHWGLIESEVQSRGSLRAMMQAHLWRKSVATVSSRMINADSRERFANRVGL